MKKLLLALLATVGLMSPAAAMDGENFHYMMKAYQAEGNDGVVKYLESLIQNANDDDAMFVLGQLYVGAGMPEGMDLLERAAKLGNNKAMVWVGNVYADQNFPGFNLEKAHQWFLKSAEAGSVIGMFNVATQYYAGGGIPKNREKAYYWIRKAAKNGSPFAKDMMKEWGIQ